jgi:hypothetical protein
VHFQTAASQLLARAYAAGRNTWVQTRLTDPTPRQVQRWKMSDGIDVTGPDKPSAAGGKGLDAKSRWARAFVRALYRQHKNWAGRKPSGSLRVEVGRHVPASPQFDPGHPAAGGFPPGRAVRIQVASGGQAALRAVRRQPDSSRIYADNGKPALRWADAAKRDW